LYCVANTAHRGTYQCGRLGAGQRALNPTPTLVRVAADRAVAGGHCTLCVTYLGEMLAFGRNDFGQLGLGALAIL
jgi:alpha-tubulin suppressor-like RCC1 family protein